MSATAQPGAVPRGAYGDPAWGPPRRGGWDPWGLVWSVPKPWLIVATVLAFAAFFPLGIAMLFFLLGTGRLGARWACRRSEAAGASTMGSGRACGWQGWRREETPTSGNRAFDEYREDTLRRLEEEQREFAGFLERLRFARDKAEFDQFMAERRPHPGATETPPRETPPKED